MPPLFAVTPDWRNVETQAHLHFSSFMMDVHNPVEVATPSNLVAALVSG